MRWFSVLKGATAFSLLSTQPMVTLVVLLDNKATKDRTILKRVTLSFLLVAKLSEISY